MITVTIFSGVRQSIMKKHGAALSKLKKCHIYLHISGNFYYTLGNISPEKRSSLSAIQLIAIVNSQHLKKYGVESILEVIMKDIRQLEEVLYLPLVIYILKSQVYNHA